MSHSTTVAANVYPLLLLAMSVVSGWYSELLVYKLYKQVPGVPATGVPVGVPPAMMAAYPVAVVC